MKLNEITKIIENKEVDFKELIAAGELPSDLKSLITKEGWNEIRLNARPTGITSAFANESFSDGELLVHLVKDGWRWEFAILNKNKRPNLGGSTGFEYEISDSVVKRMLDEVERSYQERRERYEEGVTEDNDREVVEVVLELPQDRGMVRCVFYNKNGKIVDVAETYTTDGNWEFAIADHMEDAGISTDIGVFAAGNETENYGDIDTLSMPEKLSLAYDNLVAWHGKTTESKEPTFTLSQDDVDYIEDSTVSDAAVRLAQRWIDFKDGRKITPVNRGGVNEYALIIDELEENRIDADKVSDVFAEFRRMTGSWERG